MLSSGGRRHDPARKRANWSQRRKRVRLAVEETPHDPGNVLRAHDVSEVMDSSLLSRRAGAAVAAMCPAMIGTAPGYSAAPVRAVLPSPVDVLAPVLVTSQYRKASTSSHHQSSVMCHVEFMGW